MNSVSSLQARNVSYPWTGSIIGVRWAVWWCLTSPAQPASSAVAIGNGTLTTRPCFPTENPSPASCWPTRYLLCLKGCSIHREMEYDYLFWLVHIHLELRIGVFVRPLFLPETLTSQQQNDFLPLSLSLSLCSVTSLSGSCPQTASTGSVRPTASLPGWRFRSKRTRTLVKLWGNKNNNKRNLREYGAQMMHCTLNS